MPGLFDKVKEGAQKAAAEADRLSRSTQAQLEQRTIEKQFEEALAALGRSVLDLLDAGMPIQPELQAGCDAAVAAREKAVAHQQKIADLQAGGKVPAAAPQKAAEPVVEAKAAPEPAGSFCPNCGAKLLPAARFCGECGTPTKGSAA
jgi:hypothetical protein